ncbi:putative F-box-like domain superfamily protein [Septoria linicola]|nr:putative F-box-like domain superfamily protein [Septoria linicola]
MLGQSSHAACHAVLFTTELLERILVGIDIRDLLLAQRVNSKWRKVIKRSTLLQQKLFFEPAETEFCWKVKKSSTTIESDTFIKVSATHKLIDEEESSGSHFIFKHGEMNPLIFKPGDLEDLVTDESILFRLTQNDVTAKFQKQAASAAWQYPEASWREMLTTQPPTFVAIGDPRCTIHNRHIYSCPHSRACIGSNRSFFAIDGKGLKAGGLMDAIEEGRGGKLVVLEWTDKDYFTFLTEDIICPTEADMRVIESAAKEE